MRQLTYLHDVTSNEIFFVKKKVGEKVLKMWNDVKTPLKNV